ncbi:hypothetical protein ACIBSV_11460 [Embleya sp. NPDC050154]
MPQHAEELDDEVVEVVGAEGESVFPMTVSSVAVAPDGRPAGGDLRL